MHVGRSRVGEGKKAESRLGRGTQGTGRTVGRRLAWSNRCGIEETLITRSDLEYQPAPTRRETLLHDVLRLRSVCADMHDRRGTGRTVVA
jgi:hypothetical protein